MVLRLCLVMAAMKSWGEIWISGRFLTLKLTLKIIENHRMKFILGRMNFLFIKCLKI